LGKKQKGHPFTYNKKAYLVLPHSPHSKQNAMVSFEQEFRQFLHNEKIAFTDNCHTLSRLDFTLPAFYNNRSFHIDVKEKRQKISIRNWPSVLPGNEPFTFILDDLAARKTVAHAPYAGVLVRDNLFKGYYWYSVFDLALMPKRRVNRAIEKSSLLWKGKWIIDFRNAQGSLTLADAFGAIRRYAASVSQIATAFLPCFGTYEGETVGKEGATRQRGHWQTDVGETR
jgi:hypothetical protein